MASRWWIVFAALLSACAPMKAPRTELGLPETFFTAGDPSLIPPSDKLTAGCLADKEYDSCIYLKNPVAQEAKPLQPADLESVRRFGVKIRGLTKTGFLTNAKIAIHTLNTPRFTLFAKEKLKAEFSDQESYLEQVSAYYWMNRALEYLSGRVGESRLPLTPLKVYVDDAFTGYASTRDAIHLEKSPGALPKALSGEAVVQLLGQALAMDLSRRALFPGAAAQHKVCGTSPRGCCASEAGCAQALGSAFGDYVSAMMFPGAPKLGESVANSPAGQSLCALPRDLAALAGRTKAEVYTACSTQQGQVVLMGAWYASQWWKLRQQSEAQTPGSGTDIDQIFFDHAREWAANATFAEAKAAALKVAAQHKGGKFAALITSGLSAL